MTSHTSLDDACHDDHDACRQHPHILAALVQSPSAAKYQSALAYAKEQITEVTAFLDPYIEACRQRAAFYEVKMTHIWEVSAIQPKGGSGCIVGDSIFSACPVIGTPAQK